MERQGAQKSSAMLNMPRRRRRRRREHNWSHRSSPCSSGKSASSEPRGSRNKGSVSCLQDISRGAQGTQTEELAQTSKIPDRVKAPLASRCNNCQRRRKRRSERVTDRVLNGSTHGEASKQTQSQGNLKRKMKHLSTKTNVDRITDAKRPFGVLALPSPKGATAAPHLSTSNTSSWESEEKKTDDDLSDIRLYTQTRSKIISFLRTMSPLSSVSTPRIPSPECLSLQLGTSQCPGGAPLYRDGRLQQQISQPEKERSMQRRASPTSPALTFRPSYWQIRSPVPVKSQEKEKENKKEEEKDVQTPGTSIISTLQSSDHACAASTSAQIHNPNVDKKVLVHSQEREEDPGGAAAAEYTHQHLKDSSKDIVCRPKQRPSVDLSKEENVCRICYCNDNSPENPLVSPCRCKGSMKYIHLECLKRWILVKLQSRCTAIIVSLHREEIQKNEGLEESPAA
ncbi:uncharacterized protein LOC104928472 [Larimichthys crocea]|uniref:uncharacterized protein LOC104928472 n=1 Tax=Larimichthys crocea TaxID=215358 RepID=UPI000F5F41E6|nr:uncharacterized protein LOC104928472 [Larimichthys crocea]